MRRILLLVFAAIAASIAVSGQQFNQWPLVEKSIVLNDNTRLQYAEQGDPTGVPVIFLHGYTDSWHSFESIFPHLPGNIHAFAISQRGHGDSDKPVNGYEMRNLANDVAQFVKKLELGYVIIVGHSMGGMVAQRFMLDYPVLTRGVIIAASACSYKNNKGVQELWKSVLDLKDPVDPSFITEFQKSTIKRPVENAYFTKLVQESKKLPARVWQSAMNGFMKVDYLDELTTTTTPVLIIWGNKDIICSRRDQNNLLKSIRNSRLQVYNNTGHAVHWEEPKRFAADVIDFIVRTGNGQSL
jgi:non-heme chloroperoxidase